MKTHASVSFIFILVSLLTVTCKKHDCQKPNPPSLTNAIITGVDYRKCACCGGLMITFSNDPKPNSAAFSDIRQMPSNSGIDQNSEFPIYVKVKFSTSSVNCGNYVDISELERR